MKNKTRGPNNRAKVWWFRVFAPVVVLLLPWLLLEGALRLLGYGYPTGFLMSTRHQNESVFIQNYQFGWRFFGPAMARQSAAFCFSQVKPANTVRILVLGESAAYGDRQPEFGVSRILQALLSLRYPGMRFEVINAAMTGINSHTIRCIARDCIPAKADIWVIYMGNNEVVGPFGAGTVFGLPAPSRAWIQGSLALKTTRLGQGLDAIYRRCHPPPREKSEWGGLEMFIENQVASDDPRLLAVYRHFEHNLRDILHAAQQSGAGVVLSTVAVNLRDCAPFASTHRPALGEHDLAQWKKFHERALAAHKAGRVNEALANWQEAARLDDRAAEVQFGLGRCKLALGDVAAAKDHFERARDLDALRFRCDGRLNQIIRQVAAGRQAERIQLVDAEQAFAQASTNGLPGNEFFYEHVHLTHEGNGLLARRLAAQVESLLPEHVRHHAAAGATWPDTETCDRRLAWTEANRLVAVTGHLSRLSDPPFNQQMNHEEQWRYWAGQLERLLPARRPEALREAHRVAEQAAAMAPDDPLIHQQLAQRRLQNHDFAGAMTAARRVVELLPSSAEGWDELGRILAQQKQYEEAVRVFQQALKLEPQNAWILSHLGQTLALGGRKDQALATYRRVIELRPRFGIAYLAMGNLLEEQGRKDEAERCYRQAVQNPVHHAAERAMLANFCLARGWLAEAATNYAAALQLDPSDATLLLNAGICQTALGHHSEAQRCFTSAVGLAPDLGEAHFRLGLSLGRQGQALEAVEHFREAVRCLPDLLEARVNLGVALKNAGKRAEARAQFEEVLSRNPTNAAAQQHLRELTGVDRAGETPTSTSGGDARR